MPGREDSGARSWPLFSICSMQTLGDESSLSLSLCTFSAYRFFHRSRPAHRANDTISSCAISSSTV